MADKRKRQIQEYEEGQGQDVQKKSRLTDIAKKEDDEWRKGIKHLSIDHVPSS